MPRKNLFFSEDPSTGDVTYETVDFEKARQTVQEEVKKVIKRYYPSNRMPVEDVAWDCFTTFYTGQFFAKYDPDTAAQSTYLKTGVRNYLIDCERRETRKIKPLSSDVEMGENLSLYDTVDDQTSERMVKITRYLEAVSILKDKLDGEDWMELRWAKVAKIPGVGVLKLTKCSILYLYFVGYTFEEIAKWFGLTPGRISHLYNEALDRVSKLMENSRQIDMEDPDVVQKKDSKELLDKFVVSSSRINDPWIGTPLHIITRGNRRKFVDLAKYLYIAKGTVKGAIRDLEIKQPTAYGWRQILDTYFTGEKAKNLKKTLSKWEEQLKLESC